VNSKLTKISTQDLSVIFFYFLGYSRIKNFILRSQHKPVARFVTFHDVSYSTIESFETNLHFLKKKTNVISLDDFFSGQLSSKKLNVVITFDDGYKSWVDHAIPILLKLGLPATFFVSSGFIGLPAEHETEFGPSVVFEKSGAHRTTGCLSCEDIRKIIKQGFTIGGHTVNHCRLPEIDDRAKVRDEIVEDKKKLALITGGRISYFAYPFGANFSAQLDIANILKEAGYRGAVTTISDFNSRETDPYMLHRDLTRASMNSWTFKAIVYGNRDATKILRQLFCRI
jgi:peptidoglycan/xylan/chitin deacetylase (PgdA/CDA1 family)